MPLVVWKSADVLQPDWLLLFVLTQKVNKKVKAVIKIAKIQGVKLKILETPSAVVTP